jgi:hypothetical protein
MKTAKFAHGRKLTMITCSFYCGMVRNFSVKTERSIFTHTQWYLSFTKDIYTTDNTLIEINVHFLALVILYQL